MMILLKSTALTVVDIADFEFSGTYVATSATLTDGSIVLAPTVPAGTTITQLKPVDGMMSLEPITKPQPNNLVSNQKIKAYFAIMWVGFF